MLQEEKVKTLRGLVLLSVGTEKTGVITFFRLLGQPSAVLS